MHVEKNLTLEEPGYWETHKARTGVQKSMAENQPQEAAEMLCPGEEKRKILLPVPTPCLSEVGPTEYLVRFPSGL